MSTEVCPVDDSYFPIIWTAPGTVGVGGTGFFLDASGLFVTCNHIFTHTPKGARFWYVGNTPVDPLGRVAVEILPSTCYRDEAADVVIGRIPRRGVVPVRLAPGLPAPGTGVSICGYPDRQVTVLGGNGMGGVQLSTDSVTKHSIYTTVAGCYTGPFVVDALVLQIQGFLTTTPGRRGMSGGPVCDAVGWVYGMFIGYMNTVPRMTTPGRPCGVVVDAERIKSVVTWSGLQ